MNNQLPPKFGQGIDIKVDSIYKKEHIYPSTFPFTFRDTAVHDIESYFGNGLKDIFLSLTDTHLEDVAKIYLLPKDEFERVHNLSTKIPDRDNISIQNTPAFQYGPRIFLREGYNMVEVYTHLMHELGGTLLPYTITPLTQIPGGKVSPEVSAALLYNNEQGIPLIMEPYTSSEFFHELAHYYLQFAGLIKYIVEGINNPKEIKFEYRQDSTNAPNHYHAAKEAIRLLKNRISPLQAHPYTYKNNKPKSDQIIATLPTKTGGEQACWIGPDHPAYSQGGIIVIKSIDDLCTI